MNKTNSERIKLGKIKFYRADKGYGFISSYDEEVDFYFHVTKLLTNEINIDDVVKFKVRKSNNIDKVEAFAVSNKLPVFISNNEFENKSNAFILLNDYLDFETNLSTEETTGFKIITANASKPKWKIRVYEEEEIRKSDKIFFSKKIISKLLENVIGFGSDIDFLSLFLILEIQKSDIDVLFETYLKKIEDNEIAEMCPGSRIKQIGFLSLQNSFGLEYHPPKYLKELAM